MSANYTVISDYISLTHEELIEEYGKLADSYEKCKELREMDMQQIYELKRNLQTSSNAEQYLTTELEQINSFHSKQIQKINQMHGHEMEELKTKLEELKEICAGHESAENILRKEIDCLKKEMDGNSQQNVSIKINDQFVNERESILENQIEELLAKVDELKKKLDVAQVQDKENQSLITELKENIECMKDNLESRRQEIDELQLALDTAHETNVDLNGQLNSYKANPGDANKKGNSLFAEVHDQRRQVTEVLKEQSKRYQQMKQKLSENEFEMRRLKRANAGICEELKNCSRYILQADEIFKIQLNERIAFLMLENESLMNKLTWTEKKLGEMACKKNIDWMDSILDMCRNEVQDSKRKLFYLQMQYSASTTKLWNTERELAKWKFESLKSRFILIDRESLLEENKIPFKVYDQIKDEVKIDEAVLQNAQPHVTFNESYEDKAIIVHNRSFSSHLLEESIMEINHQLEKTAIVESPEHKPEVPPVLSSSTPAKCQENKENVLIKSNLHYRDIILTPRVKPLSETIDPNVRRSNLFADVEVKEENTEAKAKPAVRPKTVIKVKRIIIPPRKPVKKEEK